MYHVTFDETARQELNRRTHQPNIAPSTRDRLEMLRLSDAGWHIPAIARHLRYHEQTVRRWIKVFLLEGFDALVTPPRPGHPSAITKEILTAVRAWIAKADRTWNARQIAEEVEGVYGLRRSNRQWRRLLRGERLTYKRTRPSLRHKQKPDQVEAARTQLAALEKRGSAPKSI